MKPETLPVRNPNAGCLCCRPQMFALPKSTALRQRRPEQGPEADAAGWSSDQMRSTTRDDPINCPVSDSSLGARWPRLLPTKAVRLPPQSAHVRSNWTITAGILETKIAPSEIWSGLEADVLSEEPPRFHLS